MSIAKRLKEQVDAGRLGRKQADALLRKIHQRPGTLPRPIKGNDIHRNGTPGTPRRGS